MSKTQILVIRNTEIAENDEAQRLPLSRDLRERRAWLMAVATEPNLPASAVRLAVVLERLADNRWHAAFPDQNTLAHLVCMSEKQIRNVLNVLQDLGWLTILSGPERPRRTARRNYQPTWPSETARKVAIGGESRGSDAPLADKRTGNPLPVAEGGEAEISGHATGNSCPSNRKQSSGTYEYITKNSLREEARHSALPYTLQLDSESAAPLEARPCSGGEEDPKASHRVECVLDVEIPWDPSPHEACEQDQQADKSSSNARESRPREFAPWQYANVADSDELAEFAKRECATFGRFPADLDLRDPLEVLGYVEGVFAAECSYGSDALPRELRTKSMRAAAKAWLRGHRDWMAGLVPELEEEPEGLPF